MILGLIIAFVLGTAAGIFTGLFPGVHINIVAAGLLASIEYFSGVEVIVLAVFVVAMAITHTFIDFIPSVFLGAPEEDSFLAVLPGHQLLREGRGYEAIIVTLYGGIIALPVILLFSIVFVFFLPGVYDFVRVLIPYILIFGSVYLILAEDEWIISGIVFIFAGFLGMFVFSLPVKEPLLPLLSGLFGVSGLVVSLKSRVKIPKQNVGGWRSVRMGRKEFWRATLSGAIAAPLCSFLPGIGSGHAAVIGSELNGSTQKDQKSFLFLVGMIGTVIMALSFVTVYAINRTRSGAAVAVSELLGEMSLNHLMLIIFVVIVSGIVAFFAGIQLARFFSHWIDLVDYRKLSVLIIFLLFAVNLALSNWLGILVLVTSSALGIFCIGSGVRRIQLMGVLLVPTILYYLV